jgi:hypothetical protein
MTTEIINGVPKILSNVAMTPEVSVMWDKIAKEVQEAPEGMIIDIPFEMPEIQANRPQKNVKAAADRDEIKTFIKFLNKKPNRRFDFIHIPEAYGDTLNKFVEVKDYESARLYAERYLL